jgi:hypothetical protein
MKKLLLILFLLPLASFGQQAQAVSTKVQVNTTNVELAEKREAVINITKPQAFNLDDIKGFVLAKCTGVSLIETSLLK